MANALREWGWDEHFAAAFANVPLADAQPARVIETQRESLRVVTEEGERTAHLAGRLLQNEPHDLPAVGDWVAVHVLADAVIVQHVLERKGALARKLSGRATRPQVLAANVDVAFLVTSCNEDFSPRRLERYLTMAWEGGAQPVVVLNKADLTEEPQTFVAAVQAVALGVSVHAVSALRDGSLPALAEHLRPGRTVVLLGSSGVGKSTLVNHLMGQDVQAVREIRGADAKGRHTTTSRQLFRLPGGALVLDTPGLRELALWFSGSGLEQVFKDIEAVAEDCRFSDCTHRTEPGCAVQQAVREGTLPSDRLESYLRLRKELDYLERRADPQESANAKRRWRAIHKNVRAARKKGWLRGDR